MRCKGASWLVLCLCAAQVNAQQSTAEPAPSPEPYTLHVYTNLIQVPTLILDDQMRPVPSLPKERFQVRLDSGPAFQPTSLRREGNDPITIALLLDTSESDDTLVKAVSTAFPQLAPQFLGPQDHVSIFALDCKLIRSSDNLPADPESLQKGIVTALNAPGLHNGKTKAACANSLLLRNSIAQIARALGELPGRRILIAVSSGQDGGSSVKWPDLQNYVAGKGIAVFGIRSYLYGSSLAGSSHLHGIHGAIPSQALGADEDLFREMCDTTGGLVFDITRFQAPRQLIQIITYLRERYIVEFPRPDESTPGLHDIQIQIAGRNSYLIRSAGVAVSLPDPAQTGDASNVPVSKSPATYGTRKPLKPSK